MSHVQLVNDVTGNKVFFKKLKSDETKFGTCSFLMPMWLIRAQLTWLYSVSWAGGGGWWFGTGHLHAPRCFFVGVFFLFVCFLRLAAISWLISHQLELFLRLCTALYVPIKGIVLLSFICSTQQQLAGEVTHLWCTKRRFIKSRSYLQKYFIARAYALWFIFVTCENNDSVLVYGSLWMVSNSVKKYPLCSISLMYSCKQ